MTWVRAETLLSDRLMVGEDIDSNWLPKGFTNLHQLEGLLLLEDADVEGALYIHFNQKLLKRLGIVDGITKRLDIADGITKRLDIADGITKRLDIADGITKRLDIADGITKRLDIADGITKRLDIADGITFHGHDLLVKISAVVSYCQEYVPRDHHHRGEDITNSDIQQRHPDVWRINAVLDLNFFLRDLSSQ
ncbi:hypothetical protein TNCV_3246321 [Trichonephila clavipes]|nr:hypothetical protein TNCV_3246321 [Trichonephila clavipes]